MEIDFNALKEYGKEDLNLRDYQKENKLRVYDVFSRRQSVMLQMPTGTGKTRLFVSIIKDIFHYSRDQKKALKVLILVHRTELIDQIDEELGYRYGLAHGIIQSGDRERKKYPIQIASVQTLSRRLNNWKDKEFDFIIIDEAHHTTADSYQKIIMAFPKAKLLGVTATPVRLSGEGFMGTFEELIISKSVKDFIKEGYLSQYDYYSVARSSFIQREIDGIKRFSQGDYAESEMVRVCDNDRIRAQVVDTYIKYANGKKGIVYTINKLHNKNLCNEFISHGINAIAIDSDTPKEERAAYIDDFRKGKYQIICNVNLFTEGFDSPDIEFVQLARPTKSLALYLQQVGRGLRVSENKEKTLFLDNVGLYNRFGFPSSHRQWRYHFEGKEIDSNKDVNNGQEKSEEHERRYRHQNLEEGHETDHLIETSNDGDNDNLDYMFLDILERYNNLKCWGMDTIFEEFQEYGAKEISMEVFKYKNSIRAYRIEFNKESNSFKNLLYTKEFDFIVKEDEKEWIVKRKCNDENELLLLLGTEFEEKVYKLIKENLLLLIKEKKQIFPNGIPKQYIDNFLHNYARWTPSIKPKHHSGKIINIYGLLSSFISESFMASNFKDKEDIYIILNMFSIHR